MLILNDFLLRGARLGRGSNPEICVWLGVMFRLSFLGWLLRVDWITELMS